jgi:ureidoglycolate dehydrogenase (NAD+)
MAVSLSDLTEFCAEAMKATGVSAVNAATTAEALATTDAMGVFTHGTKLLAGYMRKLRGGGYDPKGVPVIEREGPGWAIIDGKHSLGQVACHFAMETAIAKARQVGVAYMGIRDCGHIGAAGYFASVAARRGFIAMITGNDIPSVAAPGSRKAVLGSNPIAYGVPLGNGDPILLDMATAAVAGGKVYAAQQRGESIPSTWLIGPDGKPTTDLTLYPMQAALAPMAGHKGYGFGLWCEILSAVLPGGHITWQVGSWLFDEPSRPSWHNAGIIVIDIAAMVPLEQFERRIMALRDEIRGVPTAEDVDHVMMPGEREWNLLRQTQSTGISLPSDVIEKLQIVAELGGVRLPSGLASQAQIG